MPVDNYFEDVRSAERRFMLKVAGPTILQKRLSYSSEGADWPRGSEPEMHAADDRTTRPVGFTFDFERRQKYHQLAPLFSGCDGIRYIIPVDKPGIIMYPHMPLIHKFHLQEIIPLQHNSRAFFGHSGVSPHYPTVHDICGKCCGLRYMVCEVVPVSAFPNSEEPSLAGGDLTMPACFFNIFKCHTLMLKDYLLQLHNCKQELMLQEIKSKHDTDTN